MLITTPVLQGSGPVLGYASTAEAAKAAGEDIWCTTLKGQFMCLPRTIERAGTFKGLQRAINDWIAAKGKGISKITVDGRIGPNTLKAMNAIISAEPLAGMGISGWLGGPFTDATKLTENHIAAAKRLGLLINPNYVPDTSTGTKSGEKPTNDAVVTSTDDAQKKLMEQMTPGFGTPPSIWWFVGGVAVLGLGLYGYKKYKERQEGVVVEED